MSEASTHNALKTNDSMRKGQVVGGLDAFIAGSFSGLVTRAIIAPLDTVKIRHQLQVSSDLKYGQILRTFSTIAKEEGLLALWKGNVPGSLMFVLYGSLQFGSYAYINQLMGSTSSLSPQQYSWVVGGLAGLFSSMVTYPLDVLRTRFVANRSTSRFRLQPSISNICATEGVLGLFRGYCVSVLTIAVSTGIIFGTYESLLIYSENSEMPLIGNCASTVAGLLSKTLTFPMDTVRRRMQVAYSPNIERFTGDPSVYRSYKGISFMTILRNTIRKEGLCSLYKGLSMALCKSTPTTVISLWVYEHALSVL